MVALNEMDSPMNLARDLLRNDLPRRWQHVQGVAARSYAFEGILPGEHQQLLAAAGFAHDIGYADEVADTGFHAIDGARHLRRLGFDERLVELVAHHTCASIEADLREIGPMFRAEFPRNDDLPHDELLFCDLTTTPCGGVTNVRDRLAEIRVRYEPNHIVHRFIERAENDILCAASRAQEKLLAGSPSGLTVTSHRSAGDRRLVAVP